MSFPPKENGGGGIGPDGSALSIGLYLTADVIADSAEISKVPFDGIRFNNGITYNQAASEIITPADGVILITASLGSVPPDPAFSLSIFIFKNDLPIRQHASGGSGAPYTSANVSVIDNCVAGDRYVIYSGAAGISGGPYTLQATEWLCGVEMAYL
jgi:hypothetical protein